MNNKENHRWVWQRQAEFYFPVLSFSLIYAALYFALCLAPAERIMGAVQRVFYFHVGAAAACYVMVGVLFLGSIGYLLRHAQSFDLLAQAAAGVALLMASIVLSTGMIWGHAAWNTWWRWEPRLVSFLVLWLILCSYYVLRLYTYRDEKQAVYAAVLGVLSAINVPIVVFSIKLLDHAEQLHPQVVGRQGLTLAGYQQGLLLGILAMLALSVLLLIIRLRSLTLEEKVRELEHQLHFVQRRP